MIKKFCSFYRENIISFFNKIKIHFGNTNFYRNRPKKDEFFFLIVNDTESLVKQSNTKPQGTFKLQTGNSDILFPWSTEIRGRCKMDLRSNNFRKKKLQLAVENKKSKSIPAKNPNNCGELFRFDDVLISIE